VFETFHRAKDGRRIPIEVNVKHLSFEGREYHCAFVRDITERKRAEEARRESEGRFRSAFEKTAVGMVLLDITGRFLRANPAFCALVGYSEDELLSKTFLEITHPEDLEKNLPVVERLMAGEIESLFVEKRYLHKLGHSVWVHASVASVRDALGRPLNFIAQSQDITERKRLEDELRQAQKMEAVGRLAGGIAHDFNNLLTIILGQNDRLLRQAEHRNLMQRPIEEIKKAGERAASLTNQLLAFSRKQVLQPMTLSLNELVANMEGLLRRLIGEHITLTVHLDPALGHVKADPSQLGQVIMNLVLNARDAMPQGGTLTLTTKPLALQETDALAQTPPGRYASLVVSDTGQGMDADTQARIFEPFFTTKAQGRGTGLGLSMVYGIVTQSGGFISVRSRPGCGASFTIGLPQVDEAQAGAAGMPAAPAPPGGHETILLVEDEPGVREFVCETLEQAGYRVLTAQNGAEALALAEQCPAVPLLLTDVVMPQMSGRELAERLRARYPALHILYMSGYTDDMLLHHGVQAFIQKPFSAEDLLRKIRTTLDAPR